MSRSVKWRQISSPFIVVLISIIVDHSCLSHTAHWFMLECKKDSQHISECFYTQFPPHPHPLSVISQPLPPKTPLRAQKAMTVLTEPIRAWHYCSWMCPDEFFLGCVLSSNGLCVSGPGVRLILETGSWQGPEVDVRGKDGIRLIPISLVIDPMDRRNTCVVAGRDKSYILIGFWMAQRFTWSLTDGCSFRLC